MPINYILKFLIMQVLNACVQRKQWEGAFWVLQQLKQQGLQPSVSTHGLIMEVIHACSSALIRRTISALSLTMILAQHEAHSFAKGLSSVISGDST